MDEGYKTMDEIYLIQPNKFTLDVTYRVIARGKYIYFCRCGGQFYGIDSGGSEDGNYSDAELMAHKKSFYLKKDEIKSISSNSKMNWWTGGIDNGGTVVIETTEKQKFIIHPINDATQVCGFFKKNTSAPINVTDNPQRRYNKALEQEFEEQDPEVRKRLKMIARMINIMAVIATVALVFLGDSIETIRAEIIICSIIPIIGIVFYITHSNQISLVDLRNEKRPGIAIAVLVPSIAMTLMAVLAVNFRFTWVLFVVILSLAIIITAIMLFITKEHKRSKQVFFALPFVLLMYLFGMIMMTNVFFDGGKSKIHEVQVIDKEYSEYGRSGERKDYNLLIEDWAGREEFLYMSVSKERYNQIRQGENVEVYVRQGLWRIEWYRIK